MPRRARACATSCYACGARSSRRRCRRSSRRRRFESSYAPRRLSDRARRDGAFVVSGERVERLAAMTDFETDEGLARFERALAKDGRREETARTRRERRGYRAHRAVRVYVLMRIGVFGGTFDPVHNAHLFVAESARMLERLDRVLFVPTEQPPLSRQTAGRCGAPLRDDLGRDRGQRRLCARRYRSARDRDRIYRRSDAAAAREVSRAQFTFIIGADSLVNAHWVRFDDVLESLERFAIAPRPGVRADALARVIAAVPAAARTRQHAHYSRASGIGDVGPHLLAQGRSVRYLVPEPVWRYIVAHRLYGFAVVRRQRDSRCARGLVCALRRRRSRPTMQPSARRIRRNARTSKSLRRGRDATFSACSRAFQSARRLSVAACVRLRHRRARRSQHRLYRSDSAVDRAARRR